MSAEITDAVEMLQAFIFTLFAVLAAISKADCKADFAHVIFGNNGM